MQTFNAKEAVLCDREPMQPGSDPHIRIYCIYYVVGRLCHDRIEMQGDRGNQFGSGSINLGYKISILQASSAGEYGRQILNRGELFIKGTTTSLDALEVLHSMGYSEVEPIWVKEW